MSVPGHGPDPPTDYPAPFAISALGMVLLILTSSTCHGPLQVANMLHAPTGAMEKM